MKIIVCSLLLFIGSWLTLLNWQCFYIGFIRKQQSPSWIPLVGGWSIFLGFCFFPGNSISDLAWLAFFIDWGCVPGIGHAILYHAYIKIKKI